MSTDNADHAGAGGCCCHGGANRATPQHKSNKLKASCDFCAMSKVKCDRGQPQCSRCIKNEIVCHYSESRRIGKARRLYSSSTSGSASATTASPMRNTMSVGERLAATSSRLAPLCSSPGLSADYPPMVSASASTPTGTTVSYFDHGPQNGTASTLTYPTLPFSDFLQGLYQERSPPPPLLLGGGLGQDDDLGDSEDSLMSDFASMSRGISSSEIPPIPVPTTLVSPPVASLDDSQDDCITRACMAIKILHGPSVVCSVANKNDSVTDQEQQRQQQLRQHMRSIDDVLKTNRSVRQVLVQILECPCIHDSILLCLLALIVRRLIDSYWQLLNQRQSTPPPLPPLTEANSDTSSSSSSLSSTSSASSRSLSWSPLSASTGHTNLHPEATASCYDASIVIGGFVLGGEAGLKAIMHVVRSQIEDMGGLIDALVERYVDDAPNDSFANVWRQLVDSLRACQAKALETTE